jgi:hypothetical protein
MTKHRLPMIVFAVAVAFLAFSGPAHAFWVCGDGVCSTGGPHPESCDSCPEDCGPCLLSNPAAPAGVLSKDAFIAQLTQAPCTPEKADAQAAAAR